MRSTGLIELVPRSAAPCRVLAIGAEEDVAALRERLPRAALTAVTQQEDYAALFALSGLPLPEADWQVLDYRTAPLPFAPRSFDLIYAPEALACAFAPDAFLLSLGQALTDTGTLLTSFQNVRYHGVIEALAQGEFPDRRHVLWAKTEVVRIMHESLFKEIHFLPDGQEEDAPAAAALRQTGFCDPDHDLSTPCWLVRACRSTAEVANLKSLYTPEIRRRLACLLHRFEYDIDTEDTLRALCACCRENGIFPDYLQDFARQIIVHPEKQARLQQALCETKA